MSLLEPSSRITEGAAVNKRIHKQSCAGGSTYLPVINKTSSRQMQRSIFLRLNLRTCLSRNCEPCRTSVDLHGTARQDATAPGNVCYRRPMCRGLAWGPMIQWVYRCWCCEICADPSKAEAMAQQSHQKSLLTGTPLRNNGINVAHSSAVFKVYGLPLIIAKHATKGI